VTFGRMLLIGAIWFVLPLIPYGMARLADCRETRERRSGR
jgi:hypothetical protein